MNKIIDPHLHFFELNLGHYQWLQEANPPFWPDKHKLRQNFHEEALTLNPNTMLAGFVHIEAGFDNVQPWREIAWLESSCSLPFKTVAGIDLTLKEESFKDHINQLSQYSSVAGCRHILDEHAYALLCQENVQHNLAFLAKNHLSFDLQMPLSDKIAVDLLIQILKSLPSLRLIINHAGWPPIASMKTDMQTLQAAWQQWQSNLEALSAFQHCAIKCSGWEMMNRQYQSQWQFDIIAQCIHAFGDERVMLASNFPLVLLKQDYHALWEHYFKLELTQTQITALTYANAAHWYQFNRD
ncbi:amidohydrolase family protein [uncultured Shewanella sp.]|uniref:amidohydrolase family protein n=1 Tax=uncultured Shewanella sp. TaxID=173975 RepID=UPI002626929E|nr:amidohydrolase family protein [uncultured Shewanella sp.]